ncbi:MAG: glycoside hydrolase [Halobacteriales archaeon]|nr:glycoside hydrolase [Halobacteriales archaeon]
MRRPALVLALAVLSIAPAFAALGPGTSATPVNVRVTNVLGPANEVSIAVNPLDASQLLIGAKDYSLTGVATCGEPGGTGAHNVWAGVYSSADGGATWRESRMPGFPGDIPPTALTGYPCSSDPVVAFDNLGHAHYTGLAYNGYDPLTPQVSFSTVWVATSLDGGVTWPVITHLQDLPGPTGFFNDKQWFAFDPVTGTGTVVWDLLSYGGVAVANCPLGIACATTQVRIAGGLPTVAIGPDSVVHVATNNGAVYHASAARGAPFVNGRNVASWQQVCCLPNTNYRWINEPAIGADPGSGQNVYIAFSDSRRDEGDIYVISSHDGGATWGGAVRVNDDAAGKAQFMPALSVAPNGRVDVSFLDRRDDPGNRFNVEYVASSYDGGATWLNTRVADVGSDGTGCFHQAGFKFIGDYQGVASTDSAAHPVWPDSRNGRCDVYTASVPR